MKERAQRPAPPTHSLLISVTCTSFSIFRSATLGCIITNDQADGEDLEAHGSIIEGEKEKGRDKDRERQSERGTETDERQNEEEVRQRQDTARRHTERAMRGSFSTGEPSHKMLPIVTGKEGKKRRDKGCVWQRGKRKCQGRRKKEKWDRRGRKGKIPHAEQKAHAPTEIA